MEEQAVEDTEILHAITAMTNEEHELLHEGEVKNGLTEAQHTRLSELKVEIDRLWDLLRQRRARRHAGLNPDAAEERPASIVENYRQ
jgi:Protein of unknown function (DUF2630)